MANIFYICGFVSGFFAHLGSDNEGRYAFLWTLEGVFVVFRLLVETTMGGVMKNRFFSGDTWVSTVEGDWNCFYGYSGDGNRATVKF